VQTRDQKARGTPRSMAMEFISSVIIASVIIANEGL
jgi:hypothetical protein